MTRIAFVADAHLWNHKRMGGPVHSGINARCRLALKAFDRALKKATEVECDAVVSLGDLFDGVGPSPQLIAEVQKRIDSCPFFLALLGNHELESDAPGDNALAPLFPLSEVVEKPRLELIEGLDGEPVQLALVPFRRGPSSEWLNFSIADAVAGADPKAQTIACLHLGLQDEETPAFLRAASDAVAVDVLRGLMSDFGIGWAAAGNWHDKREFGSKILQVGTLVPTGFDNPGYLDFGWMAFWGDDWPDAPTGFRSWQVPGPRFLKVHTVGELDHAIANRQDDNLFVEWLVMPSELAGARAYMRDMIEDGKVFDGEVVSDRTGVEKRTREAAAGAASVDELAKKLAAYVQALDLPEGVAVQDVISTASSYLAMR